MTGDKAARQRLFAGVATHVQRIISGPVLAHAMKAARTGLEADEARFWHAVDALPAAKRERLCEVVVDAMEVAAVSAGGDPEDVDELVEGFRKRLAVDDDGAEVA